MRLVSGVAEFGSCPVIDCRNLANGFGWHGRRGPPASAQTAEGRRALPGDTPVTGSKPVCQRAPLFAASSADVFPLSSFTTETTPADRVEFIKNLCGQLSNFTMKMKVRLPMTGLRENEPVEAKLKLVMGDHGKLEEFQIKFDPPAGPVTFDSIHPLLSAPILGLLVGVKTDRVWMDPVSRRLMARIDSALLPDFDMDVHDRVVEKLGMDAPHLRGEGYDFNHALPEYAWQLLDLFFKLRPTDGNSGESFFRRDLGMGKILANLDEAEVEIEGNFDNPSLSLGGLKVDFAPTPDKKNIRISGKLFEPVVTINGLKAVTLNHPKAKVSLINGGIIMPLTIVVKRDREGVFPFTFEIPRYQSQRIVLERISDVGPDHPVRLEFKEGVDVQGLVFRSGSAFSTVEVKKVVAKQMAFTGFGTRMTTSPGDKTFLENIRLGVSLEHPFFSAHLQGEATGEISYFLGREELGFMKFKYLEGEGNIWVGRDGTGHARAELEGNLATDMPELRLMVASEELQAMVKTNITHAMVSGASHLTVWPERQEALISSASPSESPLVVTGNGGEVQVHQDPSKLPAWPELKKELGEKAQEVQTDVTVDLEKITFTVRQMRFGSALSGSNGKPSLEIMEADLENILVLGALQGQMYVRMPGGFYLPFVTEAPMTGAIFRVEKLKDISSNGRRVVTFTGPTLEGTESAPTFSRRDQKRCGGHDRQSFRGRIGLFQFDSQERDLSLQGLSDSFSIVVKNRLGGGCHIVE